MDKEELEKNKIYLVKRKVLKYDSKKYRYTTKTITERLEYLGLEHGGLLFLTERNTEILLDSEKITSIDTPPNLGYEVKNNGAKWELIENGNLIFSMRNKRNIFLIKDILEHGEKKYTAKDFNVFISCYDEE